MAPLANNLVDKLQLDQLPVAVKYWVAFSGGADSMALLHALANDTRFNGKLCAIHVNHHIHPDSSKWQYACEKTCKQLHVPLLTLQLSLQKTDENSARNGRYELFSSAVQSDEVLITAHHLNDQIETVIFRILRGTGLHGITGIRLLSTRNEMTIFRPMLNVCKQQILDYLNIHQLNFIDDPSNQNIKYSRNKIRHQIIPQISDFSDSALSNFNRSLHNLSDSLELLNLFIGKENPLDTLSLNKTFTKNSAVVLTTLIYHWINQFPIEAPDKKTIHAFAESVLSSQHHKMPTLTTKSYRIVNWKNQLYLLYPDTQQEVTSTIELAVTNSTHYPLGYCGDLELCGFDPINLTIKFNQQGEKIQLSNLEHRTSIKNLFQQNLVPPWERKVTPYIYHESRLIAVGDRWIDQYFLESMNSFNRTIKWHKPRQLL